MFNTKPNQEAKITVLTQCVPKVYINASALTKMKLYVDGCSDEIGWLGTAYRSGSVVTIEEVYLFDQEVHSTTTEITPEGLSAFGEAILSDPTVDGMEIWNNLKMWGHSHVNMSVFPSGQDDSQMNFFAQSGHDWFIRLIANKKGELRVDLYDYNAGVTYSDMAWDVAASADENEILHQIDALYAQLDALNELRMAAHKVDIDEEIKHKVKKKVYTYVKTTGTTTIGTTKSTGITTSNQVTYEFEDKKKDQEKESETKSGGTSSNGKLMWHGDDMLDFFNMYFNLYDLVDMEHAKDEEELADHVYESVGFYLTDDQQLQFWNIVQWKIVQVRRLEYRGGVTHD